MCKFSI